jgi:hypothetical protein
MSKFIEEERINETLGKSWKELAPEVLNELTETECIQVFHGMLEGADMMLLDLFYKALHKKLGVERTIELIKEAKE